MSETVNEIINKPEPTEEELQEFKTFVSDWFKYDDQIRKLVTATKERRRYQKALNDKIQEFMFKYKYNDLNTQHGRIKAHFKEVNAPLTVVDIKDKIAQYKDLSGENLIKQIFQDDRKVVTKKSLTRVMPKVSLSLDI
jgi:hypothetical protein